MKKITSNEKNLKLYSCYGILAKDFLFYYTIGVLFLTQIKGITTSSIVLINTFYSLFAFLIQIPATMLVSKIGLKRSIIIGNICNIIYLILFMRSSTVLALIFATLLMSIGFALKDVAEPSLLNESISESKQKKSKLLAKIQSKIVSGYHILSAISLVISGILYNINGYIPLCISLIVVFIAFLISLKFYEPTYLKESVLKDDEKSSLKETLAFAFKSRRCRCLILFSGIFSGIASVLLIYEVSLLEELNISATMIGILFAALNIICALASKMQEKYQNALKNRTLTVLGILLAITCIVSGLVAILNIPIYIVLIGIVLMYIIKYIVIGLYEVMIVKYLSNFTNHNVDTKIFAVNNGVCCFFNLVFGIIGSEISSYYTVSKSMVIFGISALIAVLIILRYMKNKVGLNPTKYSEYELQYDKSK